MGRLQCSQCGAPIEEENQAYCASCGARLRSEREEGAGSGDSVDEGYSHHYTAVEGDLGKGFSGQVRHTFSHATQRINHMVGEEGDIDLDLRDVFSAVFKKHSKEEGEILFISGTRLTTPDEAAIPTSWPKPWLFSRVFLVFAVTYIFLYIGTYVFQNINTIPGLIIIGSFAVPFSLLIFFWEVNAPRNISIYEVSRMFFIGGTSSLVITLFLYSFVPITGMSVVGSVFVGAIEEIGKLVIIAYFIRRLNPKYILNGLLIGATIGAGFAAFESAGYVFAFGVTQGSQVMLDTLFTRAWTAVGTHTVWAAISGAALVYVKGEHRLRREHIFRGAFLRLFAVPIILHAVWDIPIGFMHNLRFILLIVVAWVFIFTFINAGLKQILRLHAKAAREQVG